MRTAIKWLKGHPFIEIQMTADLGGGEERWWTTNAMIDTGLTSTTIEAPVITEMAPAIAGSTNVQSHSGEARQTLYQTLIRTTSVPHVGVAIKATAYHQPLGVPACQALVGMDFLAFGRLVLDGQDESSFFEYLPERLGG